MDIFSNIAKNFVKMKIKSVIITKPEMYSLGLPSESLIMANLIYMQPYTVMDIRLHTVTNKPYENEVTLTGQNPPLKCCQNLEISFTLRKDLDL